MSSPENHGPDLDAVVRAVAQAVLARLGLESAPLSDEAGAGAGAGPGGGGGGGGGGSAPGSAGLDGGPVGPGSGSGDSGSCLGWLLAAPLGHAHALAREMGLMDRLGHEQRILCVPEAAAALAAAGGVTGLARASVVTLGSGGAGEAGGASAWMAAAAACDVLYLGALAWHQARALAALDDRDPAVAVALDALAAGRVVRLVTGEGLTGLHRFGGAQGADRGGAPCGAGGRAGTGPFAAEAARLLRGLASLGVPPIGLNSLGSPLAARAAAAGSFARALGGLLSERDVEQAAAEGRRELRLPRETVVTPLARDRAQGLGIVIRRDD